MSVHSIRSHPDRAPFDRPRPIHEAWFYGDQDELLERSTQYVLDGLEADEAVCVILPTAHLEALKGELGEAAAAVTWADMGEVGRNPGRLVAAWRDVIDRQPAGRPVRGIGEPAFPGRTAAELVECRQHEVLLHSMLHDGRASIACPYDARNLPEETLAAARAVHATAPGTFDAGLLGEPLPPAPGAHAELRFGSPDLSAVRRFVRTHATSSAVQPDRLEELVLAINELAANSIRHGGGSGVLRAWLDARGPVFEVHDAGRITDPMVGRRCPPRDGTGGRGLWMVHHLCDLVQVRSGHGGTTVRVRVHAASSTGQ